MQVYYFYHLTRTSYFVQKEPIAQAEPEFIWIDYTRADAVNRLETWQKEIEQQTHLYLNQLHVNDILEFRTSLCI